MKQTLISQRQQRGLTLVELMIGLLVGMLVIGAVLYVFLGSRLTYKYNDTMGRIQENGRVAIEMIGQDVRMAGFIGCRRLAAYLRPSNTGSTGDVFIYGIETGSDFSDAIASGVGIAADKMDLADTGFVFSKKLADQVSDTDSLTVLVGGSEVRLDSDAINNIVTDAKAPPIPKGPAIISDCQLEGGEGSRGLNMSTTEPTGTPRFAEAFVVTEEKNTIEHKPEISYGTDGTVTPISAVTYSIRETDRTDSNGNAVLALFRNDIELVEGARDMCVRYGVAEDPGNEAVGEYVEANEVGDWKRVIAVRVELLLASVDDNSIDTTTAVPTLCDRPVPDEDDQVFDRRMYKIFGATVGLRNQVRQPQP